MILLLILTIIVSGCVNEGTQSQDTQPTDTLSTQLKELCLKSSFPNTCLAIVNEDSTLCESAENKDTCDLELAIIKGDVSACKELTDLAIVSCYNSIASKNKDSSICESPDHPSPGSCYSISLAISAEDPELCKKTLDPSRCYIDLASKLNDASICERMTTLKQRCLAVVNEDPDMCTDADYPDACLNEVYKKMSITKKDVSYCDKMTLEITDRDSWGCCWDVAVASDNPNLCESCMLTDLCYGFVAENLKDPDVCEKTNSPERCYYETALSIKRSV